MSNLINYNSLFNNNNLILKEILELNKITDSISLTLTREEAIELINERNNIIKELGRVEVGKGVLGKIIYEFYDSPYIYKDNYVETLRELVYSFYLFQNELSYTLTDEQILKHMKDSFNNECKGDFLILNDKILYDLKNKVEDPKIDY